MQILYLLLLLITALVGAVAAWNWEAFSAPSQIWLGVGSITVPLGVVLLALLVLMTIVFLVHATYLQGTALLETRRHTKELQANRELADKAEASRFTALREYVGEEFSRQAARHASAQKELMDRIVLLERLTQTQQEEASNSLAAHLGQMEDRLSRQSDKEPETPYRELPPPL